MMAFRDLSMARLLLSSTRTGSAPLFRCMRDDTASARRRSSPSKQKCRGSSASKISGFFATRLCQFCRLRRLREDKTCFPLPPPPPDLIRLLSDDEARIRRRAALAVGRVGLVEGVSALVRVLQTDTDAEVRQMAAFALGLIGDTSAVEPLRAAVGDPFAGRRGTRSRSARAYRRYRIGADHRQADLDSSRLPLRRCRVDQSRSQVDGPADAFRLGVYALTRLKAYEPLAAAVLGPDGQPRLQWWPVAYALQRIEDKRALPALLSLARSNSAYTQAFAIKGLAALKDPAALPVLLPLIDPARADSAADARGDPCCRTHRRCAGRAAADEAPVHARPESDGSGRDVAGARRFRCRRER